MWGWRLAVVLASALFFGCAPVQPGLKVGDMIPGKMFSLKDGSEYQFAIALSHGTGAMTAFNPANGEAFTGQYTAHYTGGGKSTGVVRDSWGLPAGTVSTTSTPTGAVGRGILRGNKGTVIDLMLDITPGRRPTGHGTGTDNRNERYQVQF